MEIIAGAHTIDRNTFYRSTYMKNMIDAINDSII
jgi:hypothetical protein